METGRECGASVWGAPRKGGPSTWWGVVREGFLEEEAERNREAGAPGGRDSLDKRKVSPQGLGWARWAT